MQIKRILVATAAVAATCVPAIAAADTTPSGSPSAESACRAERTQVGDATFKATYGTNRNKSNAFGKCVSKRSSSVNSANSNAATTCKAEQTADPAAFKAKYGTNKNGNNAYGKCVSGKAKATVDAQTAANVSAEKSCRTERAADPAAFKNKYGTNKNKSNAFGKCVSAQAKTKS